MKCTKPNTDQEAWFIVLANGRPCVEYLLPSVESSARPSDPNTLECFIPVQEGDQLVMHGGFTGSILYGAFDLLVDGSFLVDKRIEAGNSAGVKQYDNRRLDVRTVFDVPHVNVHTGVYTPAELAEGVLQVKKLADDRVKALGTSQEGEFGVGSITIVCSVNQEPSDRYSGKYSSMRCGTWKLSNHSHVNGGLPVEYELGVKVTEPKVSQKRASKHFRHFGQTRFGSKPWAKFVFYYRSKAAIEEAGCMIRPAGPQHLEIDDGWRCIEDGVLVGKSNGRIGARTEDEDEAIQTPPQRKKLFGQSLTLSAAASPSEPSLQQFSSEPSESFDGLFINDEEGPDRDAECQYEVAFNGPSAHFTESVAALRTNDATHNNQGSQGEFPAIISNAEIAEAIAEAELFLSDRRDEPPCPAPTAQMVPREDHAFARASDAETEIHARVHSTVTGKLTSHASDSFDLGDTVTNLPTEGWRRRPLLTSNTPLTSKDHVCELTVNHLRSHIPADGITAGELLHTVPDQLKDRVGPETFEAVLREIAVKKRDKYFLKASAPAPSRFGMLINSANGNVASTSTTDKAAHRFAGAYKPSSPRTVGLEHPSPQSLAGHKRTASDVASRESTPSKKLRSGELAERKAELLKQLEEKRQRKEAARRALEEQQGLREEEERMREETEMREIEMLEQMNADEDEELLQLERARAEQDAGS